MNSVAIPAELVQRRVGPALLSMARRTGCQYRNLYQRNTQRRPDPPLPPFMMPVLVP